GFSCAPALGLGCQRPQIPAKDLRNPQRPGVAKEQSKVLEQPGFAAEPPTPFFHKPRRFLWRGAAHPLQQLLCFRITAGEKIRDLTAVRDHGVAGEEQVEGVVAKRIGGDVFPGGSFLSTAFLEQCGAELAMQKWVATRPETGDCRRLRPDVEQNSASQL